MSNTDILEIASEFLKEDSLSDSRRFMDTYLNAIDSDELLFGFEIPAKKTVKQPYQEESYVYIGDHKENDAREGRIIQIFPGNWIEFHIWKDGKIQGHYLNIDIDGNKTTGFYKKGKKEVSRQLIVS